MTTMSTMELIRKSAETKTGRAGAGITIALLAGLALTGCGDKAHATSPASSETQETQASSSATPTPTEAAPSNDITAEETSTWGSECALPDNLAHEMGNLSEDQVTYYRKVFALDKQNGFSVQPDCKGLVDDLGTLYAQDK